jgi:hypothetical protein
MMDKTNSSQLKETINSVKKEGRNTQFSHSEFLEEHLLEPSISSRLKKTSVSSITGISARITSLHTQDSLLRIEPNTKISATSFSLKERAKNVLALTKKETSKFKLNRSRELSSNF